MAAPDRWKRLEDWVSYAKSAMNLDAWQIDILRDAADVEAHADIAPHSQAHTAELRVSYDFFRQTPEKQRDILTHELVHLIMRQDQIVESLEPSLGKLAWSVFEPQYEDATERATDHIARIIAQQLELPSLQRS